MHHSIHYSIQVHYSNNVKNVSGNTERQDSSGNPICIPGHGAFDGLNIDTETCFSDDDDDENYESEKGPIRQIWNSTRLAISKLELFRTRPAERVCLRENGHEVLQFSTILRELSVFFFFQGSSLRKKPWFFASDITGKHNASVKIPLK